MNASERAEYMAIVAALASGRPDRAWSEPTEFAKDAMYVWIAANKLAKGLER